MDHMSRPDDGRHSQTLHNRNRRVVPTNAYVPFNQEEIEGSIPERFEKQVKKHPDRIAIKSRSNESSYDVLNRAANRVANTILAQRGTGEEQIALLLENDVPMIASILGVLKAGKTYVPLDPALPRARTTYILDDAGAGLMLTSDKTIEIAEELGQDGLQLINIDDLDSSLSSENPSLSITPDTRTWILYTS